MPSPDVRARIEAILQSDDVVLFMKGTRAAPQCGFSATVVGILDNYVPDYTTVDVLGDAEIREGIKEHANWPTIPQLYVRGEFVGGCDIVRQLEEEGELAQTLGASVAPPEPPSITITAAAAAVFREALADAGDEMLRLRIDARFQHDLSLDHPAPRDLRIEQGGLVVLVDPATARKAEGLVIDYVEEPQAGFRMDNPNAPPSVRQISPTEAKALLASTPEAKFVDVRTPEERARARIEGTVLLEASSIGELEALPKDTTLVFHCHHGMRSHQAALHFLEHGFKRVYNIVGGIDAWSQEVDPAVPRY